MRLASALISVFVFLMPSTFLQAAIIHVPADQPTIQSGIDAALNGDTVLVSDGIYTGPGNRDIDFYGRAITVSSENGPENCVIDCQGSAADPHRGFRFRNDEGNDSIVRGFTIMNGYAAGEFPAYDGGGILCSYASPTIIGNIFTGNVAEMRGGGIFCLTCAPVITGNTFLDNEGLLWGGGLSLGNTTALVCRNSYIGNLSDEGAAIHIDSGTPLVHRNTMTGNNAEKGGGVAIKYSSAVVAENRITDNQGHGVYCGGGAREPLIFGNIITGNTASIKTYGGGGICYNVSHPIIANNLILDNWAEEGGAIYCVDGEATIVNNTIAGNVAKSSGGGIVYGGSSFGSESTVTNCIIWGNSPDQVDNLFTHVLPVSYSNVQGGYTGEGNMDSDPLFVGGSLGEHYLSQAAAGQGTDSPCLDSGSEAASGICFDLGGTMVCLDQFFTRTDHVTDSGVVNMGYHHGIAAPHTLLITGPGPVHDNPPMVRAFPPDQAAAPIHQFRAYGSPHYGVNVTAGDMNGDLSDELLTGAGPGELYGPHVRGFEADGTPLPGLSFMAYGTNKWGVNVAAGNIDGDAFDEIITGAGPGAVFGPHVRGWNYDGTGEVTPMGNVNFFAYGTPKWGVNVSCGDIDGDGYDEIVTGAGPGAVYGPHVRGWNVDGGATEPIPGVSFLAYGTNRMGVNVTCGDVDGDGIDEIITGPGPSSFFGAHVKGWNYDGVSLADMPGISFFAWDPGEARYGANVFAGADLNGNGRTELVVGCGPDPDVGTPVKAFLYDGENVTEWFSLDAFTGMTQGTNVAAGRF